MKRQLSYLATLGFKALPTLQNFIEVQHNKFFKSTDEYALYDKMIKFVKDCKEIPKRTDFISYDNEGFAINDNIPIFKGWKVCEETSTEKIKVATLMQKDKSGTMQVYKIYFDTKDGVIVSSLTHMSDQVTYADLAYFFEGKLKLR